MTIQPPAALRDNPITRAEILHVQRAGKMRRVRGLRLQFIILLVLALLAHLALSERNLSAQLLSVSPAQAEQILRNLYSFVVIILAGSLMAQHLTHLSQTINYAAVSIARERQNRTWDSLLLTGISARRLVWGKWWAAVSLSWTTMREAMLWRVVVVLFIGTLPGAQFNGSPPLPLVITAAALVAVYPLFGGLVGAAVGVIASLLTNTEAGGTRLSSALQFGLIISLLFMLMIGLTIFGLVVETVEPAWASAVVGVFLTPIDGGLVMALGFLVGDANNLTAITLQVGVVISIAVTVLSALVLLQFAVWLARRLGVSAARTR